MTDNNTVTNDESVDEFYMNNVTINDDQVKNIESSDDEVYTNNLFANENDSDVEVNCFDNSDDSEIESDLLPTKKRRVTKSSSDEESRHVNIKIEEDLFGTWCDVSNDDRSPEIIPFTSGIQSTGPQLPEFTIEPINFFKLFVTDELIENIASETNRYATGKINSTELRPNSTWKTWKPVTSNEITAFIGVILNMGLIPMKNIQEYWSKEPNLYIPFFSQIFRRKRFFQIFWMLQVNANETNTNTKSRMQKVNSFLKYIESKFQKYYVPNKCISIGESTVKREGKVSFVSSIKNKSTTWEVQMYVLTDATNGYIFSVLPYYGNNTTKILIRPELSLSSRIVLHLYSSLLKKLPNAEGYNLYCDQFYSNLTLANELLKLKCYFTGRLNKNNQHIPDFIKNPKFINANKTVACRSDNIMLLAWQNKRIVTAISTISTSKSCEVTKYQDGTNVNKTKPEVIASYIKYMRGLNQVNQLTSTYYFLSKSFKWWRKSFFWGIEVCLINSYILYKLTMLKNNQNPMSHYKFVSTLAKQLVGDFREGSLNYRRSSTIDTEERLDGKTHFCLRSENAKKDCLVCSKRNVKGGRHETRYICETCTRKPGLHPGECFKRYHTMKKYKM